MKDHFFTISEGAEGFYKEKGSKFIGFSFRVRNEDEVKECLENLRKQYHDARHHCYGYILNQDKVRANDDGEPNHSAGDPILGQIKSKELEQVLVVVIRYFGGTKLGVSGLINAYKTAAQEALEKAKVQKIIIEDRFLLEYGYEQTNEVMKLIADFQLNIINQEFTAICEAKIGVKVSNTQSFLKEAKMIEGLKLEKTTSN